MYYQYFDHFEFMKCDFQDFETAQIPALLVTSASPTSKSLVRFRQQGSSTAFENRILVPQNRLDLIRFPQNRLKFVQKEAGLPQNPLISSKNNQKCVTNGSRPGFEANPIFKSYGPDDPQKSVSCNPV